MLQGEIWVDTGLWGGIVPDNAADPAVLQAMLEAGVLGFKSFMIESGARGICLDPKPYKTLHGSASAPHPRHAQASCVRF